MIGSVALYELTVTGAENHDKGTKDFESFDIYL